ncbi:hypothetical protein EPN42_01550 [bacterium]|nr:MAG: hypothetical protein EPN42_01550 [bacterium]
MKPERRVDEMPESRVRHPAYFKAGTIERLVKWRGVQDGKRLPYTSKLIAVALLGHAQSNRGFTCCVSEPQLCDELGMDGKTLRKYLQPLVEFGLIETDRAREGAAKRYDCSRIYERFGEAREEPASKVSTLPQIGISSRTAQTGKASLSADSVRDDMSAAGDVIPVRPGYTPEADRDAVPVSLEGLPSSFPSSSSSHLDVSAPAARLGISHTTGIEREIVAIDAVLTSWGWLRREQRRTVQRYGAVATAGAIGYVLQQEALHPGTIREPGALFRYALRSGICVDLPAPQTGTASRSDSQQVSTPGSSGVADAVRTYLRGRLTQPVYEAFIKRADIDVAGSDVRVTCADTFAAEFLRSRYEQKVREAVHAVLGTETLTVTIMPSAHGPTPS